MENTSKPTPELITALVHAQKKVQHATDDGKNPFFKSDYATYEAVVNAVKIPLNEQGIIFQHYSHLMEGGACIETVFYGHGGSLSSGHIFVPADKRDPQAYGSALTYAKRYSLAMAAGVGHQKDDDAEAGMYRKENTQQSKKESASPKKPRVAVDGKESRVESQSQSGSGFDLLLGGKQIWWSPTTDAFLMVCGKELLNEKDEKTRNIAKESHGEILRARDEAENLGKGPQVEFFNKLLKRFGLESVEKNGETINE